jgi:hypothetical protein
MKKGAILEAARRGTQSGLIGGTILMVLCLGALGFNWNYLYDVPTSGFRGDLNWLVVGAAAALPIGVLITGASWRRRMNAERYGPIAALKRYGNPSFVIAAIEKEFATLGSAARVTPLWIGVSWVVGLEPAIHIFKVSDIVAAAHVTTPAKRSEPAAHGVRFWIGGDVAPTTIDMTEQNAHAVLAALRTKGTGVLPDEGAPFDMRWKVDREGCEQEAKTRRSLKRTA